MDAAHVAYARADPLFYDKPARKTSDASERFRVPPEHDWSMWTRVDDDHWTHWVPRTLPLPEQGWKIHVSVIPTTAAAILGIVAEFCHRRAIAFKHVRTRARLALSLAKDADRGSAGKFVTIYPLNEQQLLTALEELDGLIGGCPGPYILSDVRWRDGPLFVRYGAFLPQTVVHGGRSVPALRDQTTGELVPDVRSPSFVLPSWVRAPSFLVPEIEARADATPPAGFPVVTAALHHSNAGGVYDATIDGRRVVLKEARPHSGWTPDGRDAVDRLIDEERTLGRLPAAVSAPRAVGVLRAHGHRFLALEHVPGDSLMDAVVLRNPLTDRTSTPETTAQYRQWALSVAAQLRRQVRALHASGITHGDLHPRNVVVSDDGTVSLLDFEMSVPVGSRPGTGIGAPGFVAPQPSSPKAVDEYALASIELFMFVPLTVLLPLDPGKAGDLLHMAKRHFGLDDRWVRERLRILAREPRRRRGRVPRHRSGPTSPSLSTADIAATLSADADHERTDRLWPGDPRQFEEAPYALGFGALGVAAALAGAGVLPSEAQRDWICDSLARDLSAEPVGLMNGLAGAVWGCRAVGMPELADGLLDVLLERDWSATAADSTLYAGLPGIALTLLSGRARRPRAGRLAREMATELDARLLSSPVRHRVATDRGGLFAGTTGTALLALRLYEAFGDPSFLDLAERALDADIATLVPAPDGSLHVDEGWRIVPYLGYGSAGIGLVLAQFLDLSPGTARHHAVLEAIVAAASSPFSVQAGLLHGRAGLIHFLAQADRLGFGSDAARRAQRRHADALELHALRGATPGEIRFAGDGLLRASCDLASGAAGVLVALCDDAAATAGTARVHDVGTLPGALSFLGSFGTEVFSDPRRERGGERHGVPSLFAGDGGGAW